MVQLVIMLTAAPLAMVFESKLWPYLRNTKDPNAPLASSNISIWSSPKYISVVFRITLTYMMLQTLSKPASQSSLDRKSLRQKRDRRRLNLEKKLDEYSKLCGADVCFGIRIRESGQVFIFSADDSGFWTFLGSHLVYLTQPWPDQFANIYRTITILHRYKRPTRISSKF
jgi:hypothetical protein